MAKRGKKHRRGGQGSRSPRGGGEVAARWIGAATVAEALIWVLFLLVPLLVFPLIKDAFRLPKLLLAEWLGLASLLLLAVASVGREQPFPALPGQLWRLPAVRVVGPILLAASAGWMFTAHRGVVAEALVDLWIGAAVLVGWSAALPQRRLRRLLTGLLLPGSVLSILAVLQFHGLFRPFSFSGGEEVSRLGVTSLAGNPGDLAGFLMLAALVAQAELIRRRGRLRWGVGAVLILLLYALVVTQTLGGLAALLAASLVLWAVVLPRRLWMGGVGLVAVAGVALVLAAPPLRQRAEYIGERVSAGHLNAALTGRLDGWRVAARMFSDEPWTGVGHGAFESAFAATKLELVEEGSKFYRGLTTVIFANAHNELLEAAAEWGIFGLVALLWAGGVLVRRASSFRRRRREASSPPDRRQLADRALALAGLTGVAIISWVHFPFRLAITAYPALLLLAWVLGDGRQQAEGPSGSAGAAEKGAPGETAQRTEGRHRLMTAVVLVVLVAALGFQTQRMIHRLKAENALWRVERAIQQMVADSRLNATALWRQIALLEEASRLEPAEADHDFARGSRYLLLRRPREAIAAYRQALALEPRPETYLNLGRAQRMAEQTDAARESFLTAVKLDPFLRDQVPVEYREEMPRREELVQ